MLIAALFVTVKLEITQTSINRWIEKQIVCTHTMEYDLALIRNEMLIHIITWINLNNYGEEKKKDQTEK